MRAHTITTVIVVGVCALAIPASASADASPDVNSGYSARTPAEISHQRALMATPSVRQAVALERRRLRSPHQAALMAERAFVDSLDASASPSGAAASDGFDWGSAAVGAGAAMALVALGGAGFLTVRRRTAESSSAASMS